MKRLPLLLSIIFIASSLFAQTDTVATDAGLISGTINTTSNVHIYKGIPFAAPPVGALRWKAPQPVAHWQGVKPCDAFAASPMQSKPVPFMMYTQAYLIPEAPISEDCLYLNVWTAAKHPKEKMPVIVWIYGGGFVSGGTACAIYDGENMAKKGVVFVSIPYRVGVFGFLAHHDLSAEANGKASGNYAFLDLIAGLQWVKQNIAAFGGDENNVTIMGQSAGAFAVNALVASPVTKGLFTHAIAESGGLFSADGRYLPLADAEKAGNAFMQKAHAASIDELRNIPADSLQKLSASFSSSPVIDGYVLQKNVYDIFTADQQNDIPVLTGWNGDDGFPPGNVPDAETYARQAKEKYNSLAGQYMQAFPGSSASEIKKSLFALNRDNAFAWQAYTWATLQATKGHHNVYVYMFNRTSPGEEQYGAFHSSEIPFALDNLHTWNLQWTSADQRLADVMSDYWINFARTGNPNGTSVAEWNAFKPGENKIMLLDINKQSMQPIGAKKEFDFLDAYQEVLRGKK